MLGGPADALPADPPAEVGIGHEGGDALGERRDVALGNQEARDAVADGRDESADARGDHRAPARHRLERHHAERFVVRGHDGDVGRGVVGREPLLRLRAHEAHRAVEPEPADLGAQRGLVPVRRIVGVAADDQESRVGAGRVQAPHRVEERVEALDRREPPDPEEHRPLVEPELTTRGGAVPGREELGIHAARDRCDARRAGTVGAQELRALHVVRGDDAVRGAHDARLLAQPHRWLELGDAPGRAVLRPAERVEHLENRHRPAVSEPQRGHPRQPVVGVDQVVLDAAREAPRLEPVDELVEVGVDLGARQRRLGPRREVDHLHAWAHADDTRDGAVLRPREDVHLDAHPPELARELAHVDVHPARLLRAERGERARVEAEHRDAEVHGLGGPILTP